MKICILDAKTLGNDIDLSIFQSFGKLDIYDMTPKEKIIERIKNVDIIIDNKVFLDKTHLNNCKNLKLICLTSTGTNAVDINYVKSHNIPLTNVAGYSTNSVVQHTFAMLFYLLENLKNYDNYVKNEKYCSSDMFTYYGKPFSEIHSKTWGIIGLGEIGRNVAKAAEAFGCKIIYYSTTGKNNNANYERVSLDELLNRSDIVSIHCALNEITKNLITYKKLILMKKSAYILNMGRGSIINESDLAKAIDGNIIAGACLDVLENEPMNKDNPLLKIKNKDNLLITPHIAWASIEARKRLVEEVAKNIEAFLKGEKRNRIIF